MLVDCVFEVPALTQPLPLEEKFEFDFVEVK